MILVLRESSPVFGLCW